MSHLTNPYAFTVAGDSIYGYPVPELRAEGAPMSAEQISMARGAYNRFVSDFRVSLLPFHTQQGVLPDGSRFRIVAMRGHRIMQVWPANGGKSEPFFSGFIFTPLGEDAEEFTYIIDAESIGGAHTGRWLLKKINDVDFAGMYHTQKKNVFLPTIKGPGGLPYLLDGHTYGLPVVDWDIFASPKPFAIDGSNAYSISYQHVSETPDSEGWWNLVVDNFKIEGEIGLGKSGQHAAMTGTSFVTGLMANHFNVKEYGSFNGDKLVAGVRDVIPASVPGYRLDLTGAVKKLLTDEDGTYWIGNSGAGFTIANNKPGAQYQNRQKIGVFSRSGGSFSLERSIDLPADSVSPAGMSYQFVFQTSAGAYVHYLFPYGGMVNFAGTWATPVVWSLTLTWKPAYVEAPEGIGSWQGPSSAGQSNSLSVGTGNSSSVRYSLLHPAYFGVDGKTNEVIGKTTRLYSLTITGGYSSSYSDFFHGPYGLFEEKDSMRPLSGGAWDPEEKTGQAPVGGEGYSESHSGGSSGVTETSSLVTECEFFGVNRTWSEQRVQVQGTYSGSAATIHKEVGLDSRSSSGNASVYSETVSRNLLIHDNYLKIICYTEHISSINYALSSRSAALTRVDSGFIIEDWETAESSAGPRVESIAVVSNRIVIERNNDIKVAIDVPIDPFDRFGHRELGGFPFGSPSRHRGDEYGTPVPSVPSPSFAKAGDGRVCAAMCNQVTGENVAVGASVDYWKSPITGAMIIRVRILADGATTFYAVDRTGIRKLENIQEILGIPNSVFSGDIM